MKLHTNGCTTTNTNQVQQHLRRLPAASQKVAQWKIKHLTKLPPAELLSHIAELRCHLAKLPQTPHQNA